MESKHIRQMVVQSELGCGDLKVYLDTRSRAVIVAKRGTTIALGAWDGETLALSYNRGFMKGDKNDVEFALRIEGQP